MTSEAKEPPDKPCGCGGPLYEGHAMHTLACPKLTAAKPIPEPPTPGEK